jgi:hypothetical protein
VANAVKPRLPQEAILFHDSYGNTEEPALVKAYDEEMAGFSRRSGMGDENWSGRVLLRMGKLAALSGRDKMVAVLRGMGFPLK